MENTNKNQSHAKAAQQNEKIMNARQYLSVGFLFLGII